MKVVFIAGPFRGPSPWAVECNIRRAEEAALVVWSMSAVALCPHANTRYFDKVLPDDVFLRGTQELLRRSDAVFVVRGWEHSRGTQAEIGLAERLGIPIFYKAADLQRWLEPKTNE